MKDNRLKKALDEGRIPVGHMLWEFGVRGAARMIESAGADFCIVDMEHSGFGHERICDLMQWFRGTDVTPFVRTPGPDYSFIARVMDAGALGVMIPNVESAEAAKRIVDAVKYAPLGKRGVGLGGAHTDYQKVDPQAYFERSNSNTTVICQIESAHGVENAQDIAAIEGVDILWVGHFDLTQSMGIPGEFQDAKFLQALEIVVEAAKRSGKAAGIQPASLAQAEQWLEIGYNVISWKTDSQLYQAALKAELAELRRKL